MDTLPRLIRVHRTLNTEHIQDIAAHVDDQCAAWQHLFKPGEKIALAVGSRGISNMALIAKRIVAFFRNYGCEVVVIPAMGSHGGATAEGQREVLEGYGITAEYVGAEILSSMDTVELDSAGLENRVFIDKNAWSCDSIIVVNRIKAHTDFSGEIESGLLKMCAIGLGKQKLAQELHSRGLEGLRTLIRPSAERIIRQGNVKLGFAIVENPSHQTQILEGIPADNFYETEKKLLAIANTNIAQLPVGNIDILCVDEMGKNISGVGIDPNVIGHVGIRGEKPKNGVRIQILIVNDLTPDSHGNAIGVGLADLISEQLYRKIDYSATHENTITSGFLERGRTPMVLPTYEDALRTAIQVCGKDAGELRILRIKNTQELSELYVSQAVLPEIERRESIETVGDFVSWEKIEPL
jgi:hypothetical protein